MTSAISPIGGFSSVPGLDAITGPSGPESLATGTTRAEEAQGPNESFASMLSRGLESVQASQNNAEDLATKVATGELQDPAQYTMAANEAQLGMQLTLAVRNKAVEAFQEIMRMQA
ncbi:flagellar hook-basal body complex protein FliE [Paractinoplanes atraurantiacus]|uniref:Flagellar hook-basal body complex protein FliE n=1 Tax=Paractinoplanes atraurantiacus TaxID=1036182 RepID=A0A285F1G8_9ACTN|nr:flagellar hook-basal body complex protein FliE [Actinoplanes atraurantiacus]SNY05147.1 flagellar hook-basal body complex protein FliE [Actinoplanes atraurantiacus]